MTTKVYFDYYLHDNYSSAEFRDYMEDQGITLTEEVWKKVYRPFYEVGLSCEIDTETGKIEILSVHKQ
jgi:hypothetical protein